MKCLAKLYILFSFLHSSRATPTYYSKIQGKPCFSFQWYGFGFLVGVKPAVIKTVEKNEIVETKSIAGPYVAAQTGFYIAVELSATLWQDWGSMWYHRWLCRGNSKDTKHATTQLTYTTIVS